MFRFTGAEAGAGKFATLSAGATTLAAAEGAATVATGALSTALAALGGPIGIIVAALSALAVAGAALGKKGLEEFAGSQENLYRTTILFRNLGTSLPIEELQSLSTEIQRLTGFDDDLVIALGGTIARFGVAGDQIPEAVGAIADAAAATGQTFDQLGDTFGLALLGQSRGLRRLGIEFKATGDRAADAARLIELFNERFQGAGEGRRQTLAGTFDAFRNSLANLFEAIGRVLAPAVITVLNGLIKLIDFATDALTALADRFPAIFPHGKEIAERLKGAKGDPEQTALLEGIEANTAKIDPLIKQVLGGRGVVARGAFSWRDARISFGI